MENVFLTVKEVAELKGCTERSVQLYIKNQTLDAVEITGQKAGNGGIQYRIPISALDKPLQLKYKRKQMEALKAEMAAELTGSPIGAPGAVESKPAPLDIETITTAEREQIAFWKSLLQQWESFRAKAKSKADGDLLFEKRIKAEWEKNPPPFNVTFSLPTMYRKKRALKTEGEAALIDHRGKHGNHARKLTDEMITLFEGRYLNGNKPSVELCRVMVGEDLKKLYGYEVELPHVSTFARHVERIPEHVLAMHREGMKTFEDKYAPYIPRDYTTLAPNDVWVVDGHTLDVIAQGKDGKPVRLYLSVWMDIRTRKMMGWVVTDRLDGDSTLYAFRKGVEKYGAPKIVLADNGRENLFYDFMAAAGFRKKADTKDVFIQPTILGGLGTESMVALPMHPKSKPIERAFKTLIEGFSKLFPSYTGGNVMEKPDALKSQVKNLAGLPTMQFMQELADTYISGGYNKHPHRGDGMNGKAPDTVYAELPYEKRVVPKDRLNVMFMRYSKGTLKVGKNGVTLKIYGGEVQFKSHELYMNYCGKEVYLRYSPEDLSSVRVYDTDGTFICEAPQETRTPFISSKEELQEKMKKNRAMVKAVKNYKNVNAEEEQSALDLILAKHAATLASSEEPSPSVLQMVIDKNEKQKLPKAAGAEGQTFEPLDYLTEAKKFREQKLA